MQGRARRQGVKAVPAAHHVAIGPHQHQRGLVRPSQAIPLPCLAQRIDAVRDVERRHADVGEIGSDAAKGQAHEPLPEVAAEVERTPNALQQGLGRRRAGRGLVARPAIVLRRIER